MPRSVPLEEIQGIGPEVAARLEEIGIRFVEDLLAMPAGWVARIFRETTSISAESAFGQLIPQGRLLMLTAMTGRLAETLVELGYGRYRALLEADAANIKARLDSALSSAAQPVPPDLPLIKDWQIEAGRLAGSINIRIDVIDRATREPIEGALARINGSGFDDDSTPITATTNEHGAATFVGLAPLPHKVVILKKGYRRSSATSAKVNSWIRVQLTAGDDAPAIDDEFDGGYIINSPGDASVLKKVELGDLQPTPPFVVAEIDTDVIELHSLWRVRSGDVIVVPYVRVGAGDFPTTLCRGQIVELVEGGWDVREGLTVAKWRRAFFESRRSAIDDIFRRV